MVIVCQNRILIVENFHDIYYEDTEYSVNSICATPCDGVTEAYILGEYGTYGRCQEVMQQIVNAYKEGLPVFEMPKE